MIQHSFSYKAGFEDIKVNRLEGETSTDRQDPLKRSHINDKK